MSAPRVSVIMPAYNAAPFIERAIRSVLAQSLPDLELIVVDDASQDGTAEIADGLAGQDRRVRCIRLAENGKAPHASNVAIAAARSDWIAVVDADDWIVPERLGTLLALGEQRGSDIVGDNQFLFDQQAGRCIGTALPARARVREIDLRYFLARSITGVSRFDHGMLKPLLRTAFLRRSGVRYAEACHDGYDFQLLFDLLVSGARLTLTEQPYYVYMQPLGAASRRPSDATRVNYRYRYHLMQQHTEQSVRLHAEHLSTAELALLRRRGRAIARFACYLQAKDALFRAEPGHAAALLRQYPMAIGFAGYALLRRLGLRRPGHRLEGMDLSVAQ